MAILQSSTGLLKQASNINPRYFMSKQQILAEIIYFSSLQNIERAIGSQLHLVADNKHLPMVIRTIPLLRKSFFFIYQWKVSYRKRSFNREGDIYRKGTYSVFWPKTPQGNQLNLKRVIQFGRRNDKLSMFLRFMDILVVFHNFLSYFPFYLSGLCAKE